MIEIKHLRKEFPEATPLADVNAVINKGDIINETGRSASKSCSGKEGCSNDFSINKG